MLTRSNEEATLSGGATTTTPITPLGSLVSASSSSVATNSSVSSNSSNVSRSSSSSNTSSVIDEAMLNRVRRAALGLDVVQTPAASAPVATPVATPVTAPVAPRRLRRRPQRAFPTRTPMSLVDSADGSSGLWADGHTSVSFGDSFASLPDGGEDDDDLMAF